MEKYQHLSQKERLKLYSYYQDGLPVRQIAAKINRSPSTVSRELRRNKIQQGYLPDTAQKLYRLRYRGRPRKINPDTAVYHYIRHKLIAGWSPEQISGRMKVENKPYYVCHETIYQYVYQERQGKTWYAYLARAKPTRGKRKGRKVGSGKYLFIRSIHDRPSEVMGRQQIGHWEADTIGFSSHKYENITTLVERKSRYLIMIKNKSRQSASVMGSIKQVLIQLPRLKRRTITFDQGSEFAQWRDLQQQTKCRAYYCDPHSPWQRGTNENTNGRIRRFLPRSTLIQTLIQTDIDKICKKMNTIPRKVLRFHTPKEMIKLNFQIDCCTSNLNAGP
jgi:IS30 family transposase